MDIIYLGGLELPVNSLLLAVITFLSFLYGETVYLLLAKMLQPFQRQKNVSVNQHPMCDDTQSFF